MLRFCWFNLPLFTFDQPLNPDFLKAGPLMDPPPPPTSVQMVSWGPGCWTRVGTAVPSPSRLRTTTSSCGIPARARLCSGSSPRPSPSAPTGRPGVPSGPASASRVPTSIIWTRPLDVWSPIAGTAVPRWTAPNRTDSTWNSDCLRLFRPHPLLSCRLTSRPWVA